MIRLSNTEWELLDKAVVKYTFILKNISNLTPYCNSDHYEYRVIPSLERLSEKIKNKIIINDKVQEARKSRVHKRNRDKKYKEDPQLVEIIYGKKEEWND